MECLHPQYLTSDGVHWFWSNCGKCFNCKKMKVSELVIRMRHEMSCHKDSTFLTLTYAPEALPVSRISFGVPKFDDDIVRGEENLGYPTLFQRDVQLFMKSLRKRFLGVPLKVFYCGEYGGQFKRPHYHAILFGVKSDDCRIEKTWKHGFIDARPATIGRCHYVAKYMIKEAQYTKDFCISNGLQPQFHQASNRPGLGAGYLDKNKDKILSDLFIFDRGRQAPIPRYYFKKLKELDETISERIALKNNEFLSAEFARDPSKFDNYLKKHDVNRLHQLEKNKLAEAKMKGI